MHAVRLVLMFVIHQQGKEDSLSRGWNPCFFLESQRSQPVNGCGTTPGVGIEDGSVYCLGVTEASKPHDKRSR